MHNLTEKSCELTFYSIMGYFPDVKKLPDNKYSVLKDWLFYCQFFVADYAKFTVLKFCFLQNIPFWVIFGL